MISTAQSCSCSAVGRGLAFTGLKLLAGPIAPYERSIIAVTSWMQADGPGCDRGLASLDSGRLLLRQGW